MLTRGAALGCGWRLVMAQWLRQYSGHTHETRVEDLEAALRKAVHAFRMTGSEPERRKKAKSVLRLAKRLLSARRRVRRAWLGAAPRVASEGALAQEGEEIESLPEREAAAIEQGVLEILAEFDARDAMAG
jgi:hypothetical protein